MLESVIGALGVMIVAYYTTQAKRQADEMEVANTQARDAVKGADEATAKILGQVTRSAAAAERSAVGTEAASERLNRAWITTQGPRTVMLGNNGELTVDIVLENTGHSPAIGWFRFGLCDYPGKSLPPGELLRIATRDRKSSMFVLAPGRTADSERISFTVRPEHLPAITSGSRHLFVFGRIEYEDGFGHPRHTFFSLWGTPPICEKWMQSPADNFAD